MAYREIENGDLISLGDTLGKEPLNVAVYADVKDEIAMSLLDTWRFGSNGSRRSIKSN